MTKPSSFRCVIVLIVLFLFPVPTSFAKTGEEILISKYQNIFGLSSSKTRPQETSVQAELSSPKDENLATVYFAAIGLTPQFQIFDGENHIGAVYGNHTVRYEVMAGNYFFSAGFLAGNTVPEISSVHLKIESGGVYYLTCKGERGRFHLQEVSNDRELVERVKKKSIKNKVLVKSEKEKKKFQTLFGSALTSKVEGNREKQELPVNNRREEIFQALRAGEGFADSRTSSNENFFHEDPGLKISRIKDPGSSNVKYRRSSLYTLMIHDETREYNDVIRDAFGNFALSVKFNDHNLGPYLIPGTGGEKDQSALITRYLEQNQLAKGLVAKWFNRDENGGFNMDLIAERGAYDASAMDVKIAKQSQRGLALLADAGEELIKNTFVIINDFRYTSYSETGSIGIQLSLKGYIVRTTSYLYRLEWNEEVANSFYSDLWFNAGQTDPERKAAFENSNLFKLKYIGSQTAWSEVTRSTFSKKSQEELVAIATARAADKSYSKLQRVYEEFRTKSPLYNAEPIAAKIGLKEGLEKGDRFEVLEQIIDDNGRTSYKRIGTIQVDGDKIWDNTGYEEGTPALEFTQFTGSSRGLFPGLLIRQIN